MLPESEIDQRRPTNCLTSDNTAAADLSVRVSPISRTAAILIIAVGAFILLTGLIAGVVANEVAGAAFILLGAALYGLLLRFTRKLRGEAAGSAN